MTTEHLDMEIRFSSLGEEGEFTGDALRFSTLLSSGARGGKGSRVMLAGMRKVFASCHPA